MIELANKTGRAFKPGDVVVMARTQTDDGDFVRSLLGCKGKVLQTFRHSYLVHFEELGSATIRGFNLDPVAGALGMPSLPPRTCDDAVDFMFQRGMEIIRDEDDQRQLMDLARQSIEACMWKLVAVSASFCFPRLVSLIPREPPRGFKADILTLQKESIWVWITPYPDGHVPIGKPFNFDFTKFQFVPSGLYRVPTQFKASITGVEDDRFEETPSLVKAVALAAQAESNWREANRLSRDMVQAASDSINEEPIEKAS